MAKSAVQQFLQMSVKLTLLYAHFLLPPPPPPPPHSPLPQPLPLLVPKCWLWCWRFSCGSYFALLFSGVFSNSLKLVFPFLVSFCWIEFCWLFKSLHHDWLFCSFFFFFFHSGCCAIQNCVLVFECGILIFCSGRC